jgi:hypothetical protein
MLPADAPLEEGAARLMARRAVVAMRSLRESHRFVRGVVAWLGFRQTELEYEPEGFAPKLGATWRAAWGALSAFSTAPLRLSTYFGLAIGAFALFLGVVSTIVVATGAVLPGWFAGAIIAALLSAVQLVAIGILGDYVGQVYDEVKRRPLFVVSERVNIVAPDDDIVDDVAPPPLVVEQKPMIAEPKPNAPPAATLMGIPAPHIPGVISKTAPMAQVPAPPAFPAPNALPAPVSTTAPVPTVSNPASGGRISASMQASVKTVPVSTVRADLTASLPTAKPGTLEAFKPGTAEVPTVPQPDPPTIREEDATMESPAISRPSTKSNPPPSSRSSAPPPLPAKTKPPPIPKRAKKD